MAILDPKTWRAATAEEVLKSLQDKVKKPTSKHARKKREHSTPLPGLLVFRSLLNPLDTYAYLRARFGEPNGMQYMMIHKFRMVEEDSSNMINWDYALKSDDRDFTITGAGREVHVMMQSGLSDAEWLDFASALKADFENYGSQKSEVIKSLEKWYIFPNRFKAVAERCAELQNELSEAVEKITVGLPLLPRGMDKRAVKKWGKDRGELTNSLVATSVQLSLLTPIMFESFIGLISAVLMQPAVRRNKRVAEAFRRSQLDLKIYDLASRCFGFAKPIEESNDVMRRYWSVVNERNDIIHGNVDPVRDALEVVYFDGKTPMFPKGGDPIEGHFDSLVSQYSPEKVLNNYLLAHEMIAEILSHMARPVREAIIILLDDGQPGWDDRRGKFGKLFPDYVGGFYLQGTRYDTDILRETRSANAKL